MSITEIQALKRHEAIRRLSKLAELRRRIDEEMVILSEYVISTPKRGERPPCGTERGYQWHRYHDADNWPLPKDDPCECRAAHAAFERARTRVA